MTTNNLFVLCTCLILVMSLVCGHFAISSSFEVGEDFEELEAYNVVTFIGHGFFALLTFSITGMPEILGAFLWCLVFIELWCVVRLIRGVS